MVRVSTLSPSLSPNRDVTSTHTPFWHFQYWVVGGTGEGRVMVMVTVEPGVMEVTLKLKKPWGKLKPDKAPQGVVADALSPVMEPALVETLTLTCFFVMREAMEEVIKMGLPRQAVIDFLLGHIRCTTAIVWDFAGAPVSDGAKLAVSKAMGQVFQPATTDRASWTAKHRTIE